MANALPAGTTGMSAVLGLSAEKIEEVCKEIQSKGQVLEIANYNCPGQIVVTGQKEALEQAEALLMEKGARRVLPFLKQQICHSVRFEQTIRNMIRDGVDTFVEIGPGKTLSGFVRKVDRSVKVYTINTVKDLEGMVEAWNK